MEIMKSVKIKKLGQILALIITIGFSPFLKAESPVNFVDTNLKAKVESVLGVFNPTPTDMLSLTVLNASNSDFSLDSND